MISGLVHILHETWRIFLHIWNWLLPGRRGTVPGRIPKLFQSDWAPSLATCLRRRHSAPTVGTNQTLCAPTFESASGALAAVPSAARWSDPSLAESAPSAPGIPAYLQFQQHSSLSPRHPLGKQQLGIQSTSENQPTIEAIPLKIRQKIKHTNSNDIHNLQSFRTANSNSVTNGNLTSLLINHWGLKMINKLLVAMMDQWLSWDSAFCRKATHSVMVKLW